MITPHPHTRSFSARRRLIAATVVGGLVLAACGSDDDDASDDTSASTAAGDDTADAETGALLVATTVAPITSIAANIIGEQATIEGIVPEGTNSHTFEPQPSVAELVSEANVIFINGLVLEEPTKELALANKPDATPLVELGDETITPDEYKYDFSFPEDEGKPNPHLWTDPSLALNYAAIIRDTMSEVDPDNADTYAANYDTFTECVDELDAAMSAAFETIPEENKQLLTYHDAYAYFAENYGFEVIGAVQPADFGDPSPSEVADLIDQVRDTGVPALFGSEVFPSPVLDQIASEAGGTYVDTLRDDDLPGAPGDDDHSWVGLMRSNYITMTEALGGDPAALESFEVCGAAPDSATYPQ
ncbi:MAG: metal ABC transporter substrate-binding protein [Actinomycetota bacterium]